MKLLGISCYFHDSAACLVDSGRIVAAALEERFTRKKHDEGFPTNAVRYCLERSNPDLPMKPGEPVIFFMHGIYQNHGLWFSGGFSESRRLRTSCRSCSSASMIWRCSSVSMSAPLRAVFCHSWSKIASSV